MRERAGEHIIRTQLNASTGDVKPNRETGTRAKFCQKVEVE